MSDENNINNNLIDQQERVYDSINDISRRSSIRDQGGGMNFDNDYDTDYTMIDASAASSSSVGQSQSTQNIFKNLDTMTENKIFRQQVNLIICVFLIVLSTLGMIASLAIICGWIHRKITHSRHLSKMKKSYKNRNNNKQTKNSKDLRPFHNSTDFSLIKNCIIPIGSLFLYIGCILIILTSLSCQCWILAAWLIINGFNLIFGYLIWQGYRLRDLVKRCHHFIESRSQSLKDLGNSKRDQRIQLPTNNNNSTNKIIRNPYDENLNLIDHHNKLLLKDKKEKDKDNNIYTTRHTAIYRQPQEFSMSSSDYSSSNFSNNFRNVNFSKSETQALAVSNRKDFIGGNESDLETYRDNSKLSITSIDAIRVPENLNNRKSNKNNNINNNNNITIKDLPATRNSEVSSDEESTSMTSQFFSAIMNFIFCRSDNQLISKHQTILLIVILLVIYDNLILLIWTLNYDVISQSIEGGNPDSNNNNNDPSIGTNIFNWISLWPLLLISSKLLYLLLLINVSWKLQKSLPKLSSPTNNVILASSILASTLLIMPIIERRQQLPNLFMVVTSLLLLLHTTACLLLTQIPRLRRSSVLRTDSQLILREFDFFGRGERREEVAVNVSRYDHEAVNLR